MNPSETHEELQELLGAYALDAVDGDERTRLEDHLRECARCRDEVQQHQEVAAHLAYGGAPAPEGLWGRIAAALEADDPSPDLAAMYPLGSRRRPRWAAPALLAAAAVLVAALGVLGWQVHRESGQVSSLRAALGAPGLAEAAAAAVADPRARVSVLASGDGRVRLTGVLEPDGSGYLLHGATLPALPAGETYQLWGIAGSDRISLGLLGANPAVVAFHAAGSTINALAITAERASGAVQPTRTPVVVGQLPPV
jgi:Anti-sigma-K factor rskA/Putative zinc-finger